MLLKSKKNKKTTSDYGSNKDVRPKNLIKRSFASFLALALVVTCGAFSNIQFAKANEITRSSTSVLFPYSYYEAIGNVDGVSIHDGSEGYFKDNSFYEQNCPQAKYTDAFKRTYFAVDDHTQLKNTTYSLDWVYDAIRTTSYSATLTQDFVDTFGLYRANYIIDGFTDIDGDIINCNLADITSNMLTHTFGEKGKFFVDGNNMLYLFPHYVSTNGHPRTSFLTGTSGSGAIYQTIQQTHGSSYVLPETNPVKNGYGFKGWYTAWSEGTKRSSTSTVNNYDDRRLYARWVEDYNVTLVANGGTVETNKYKVSYGSTYGSLPTPAWKGHTFTGWNTAGNGSGLNVKNTTKVTRDAAHTLYAQWDPYVYNLTYNLDGGSWGSGATHPSNAKYDSSFTVSKPVKTGYTFKGWSIDGGAVTTNTSFKNLSGVNGATVAFKANWSANKYTLTFNANGGNCTESSRSVACDAKYGTLPVPTKSETGYNVSFKGWNTKADGSGTYVTDETVMGSSNVTLYAQYTKSAKTDCVVTVIDRCSGNEIGRNTFNATYGTTVSGSKLNGNVSASDARIMGKYYSKKIYTGCTSATVSVSGTVVYRDFVDYSDTKLPDNTVLSEDRTTIISVPNSVTDVYITKNSGITKIADNAFKNCTSLKTFGMDTNTVISIGSNAFTSCSSLTDVDLKYSVKAIGTDAFKNCINLVKLTIKNPECSIGGSTNTIPNSTVIYAFSGSTAETYKNTYTKIMKPITMIDEGLFLNETSMIKFTIPDNVKSVSDNAFKNCTGLKTLNLGNITSIGNNAFENTSVTTVQIPKECVSIGDAAFNSCTSLTKADFEDGSICESIGETAFANTALNYRTDGSKLRKDNAVLFLPETLKTIGKDAYLGCNSLGQVDVNGVDTVITDSTSIPKSTTIACYAGSKAYEFAKTNDYGIHLWVGYPQDKKTSVGTEFASVKQIKCLTIGPNIKKIGASAFKNHQTLNYICDGGADSNIALEEIGSGAFAGCKLLTTVNFSTVKNLKLKKIADNAFNGCTALTRVDTPNDNSLAEIGSGAFAGCTKLTTLQVYNPNCVIASNASTFATNVSLKGWSKSTANDYCNTYKRTLTKIGTSFQIIFDKNGGQGGTDKIYAYTKMNWSDIEIPAWKGHTFTGYTFNGKTLFNANGKCQVTSYVLTDDMMGNSAPVAQWTTNTYTIAYDGNSANGSVASQTGVKYDTNVKIEANGFTKKGYTFTGWNTEADGSGTAYAAGDTVKELSAVDKSVVTLYAQWRKNNYKVAFDLNGVDGEAPETINMVYDSKSTMPTTNAEKMYYTFAGWNTKADGSGTSYAAGSGVANITDQDDVTVTLYAYWKPVDFDISYDLDGGQWKDGETNRPSYNIETDDFELNKPVMQGYAFTGWTGTDLEGSEKNVVIKKGSTGARSYVAHWGDKITYHISYDLDGGTLAENKSNPETYDVETETFKLNNPEKTGHKFIGWIVDDDDTPVFDQTVEEGTTGDLKFKAVYKALSYKVTLNTENGEFTDESDNITSYTYGDQIKLPTGLTRKGYYFLGWSTIENTQTTNVEKITATDLGDKTFYAVWKVDSNVKCKIKYMDGSKELLASDIANLEKYRYIEGTNNDHGSLSLPTSLTKDGYTFAGWYDNDTFDGEKIDSIEFNGNSVSYNNTALENTDSTDELQEIVFYAKWSANSYNVTLNTQGGSFSKASDNVTSHTFEKSEILPTSVTKEGYTFAGWYDNKECAGAALEQISATLAKEVTYYAKWIPKEYKVTLYTNEGKIHSGNVAAYTYGVTKTLPDDISRTGCTFAGWYDNKSFKGTAVTEISDKTFGDVTYYAKWIPNTYHISYVTNDGKINEKYPMVYSYNTKTVLPTSVTKDGYTFAGWYDNAELSGERVESISVNDFGNKTYYAKWEKDTVDPTDPPAPTVEPSQTPVETPKPTVNSSGVSTVTATEVTHSVHPVNKVKVYKGITYKVVKNSVTVIKAKKSLKKASIPNTMKVSGKTYKVTKVANNAFKGCKKLKKVTIGKNVTKIGKNAFKNCKKLKNLTIKASNLSNVGSKALNGISKKAKITVSKNKLLKYKKILKGKGQRKTVKITK